MLVIGSRKREREKERERESRINAVQCRASINRSSSRAGRQAGKKQLQGLGLSESNENRGGLALSAAAATAHCSALLRCRSTNTMSPLHSSAHSPTTATRTSSTAAFQSSLASKKMSGTTAPCGVVLGPQRAVLGAILTAADLTLTDRLARLHHGPVSASIERRGASKGRGADLDLAAAAGG